MSSINNLYKKMADRIDIPFLLFLMTISSNKIIFKVFALILIFALRPRFDFIFSKRISLFYPLIIILALFQFLVFGHDFSLNHFIVFLTGAFYWFICYAYMYQTYLFVNTNNLLKVNNTIIWFLWINFSVCLFNYFQICYKAHTLLPFLQYEGSYGASTGDYICGLFGVPSYINAIICSLLAFYFIHQNKFFLFTLATFCALLSFANIINLIFVGVLLIYLVFAGDNRKRIFVVLNIILCFLMYIFISPDNYNYIKKTIGLSVNNEREIMPEVIIAKQGDSLNVKKTPTVVKYVNDSSAAKQKILMLDRGTLFNRTYNEYKTYHPVDIKMSPGKKIAILQTLKFLKANPVKVFVGAGMGNFSSRLAFQFSGRDSSRLFMKLPKYCSGYYFQNNLLIYDSMRQLPTEYHSIKHFPNNFFSQLLGEYGLIGMILFLVFYVGFFYKRVNSKSFFFILFFCVSGYLMLDYFFEFFNVMVIVEMILFIDIKQKEEKEVAQLS